MYVQDWHGWSSVIMDRRWQTRLVLQVIFANKTIAHVLVHVVVESKLPVTFDAAYELCVVKIRIPWYRIIDTLFTTIVGEELVRVVERTIGTHAGEAFANHRGIQRSVSIAMQSTMYPPRPVHVLDHGVGVELGTLGLGSLASGMFMHRDTAIARHGVEMVN